MLLKANWKDGRFQGTTVPRGSFVSSLQNLSSETGLTIREIRTAISHLKTTGEVTSEGHNKYSVFTVVNYDLYQSSDTQTDTQATWERHSNDILTTTIEERKEGKKERREEKKKGTKVPKEKYFPTDDLLDKAFADFVSHRKAMKKPMTEIAIDRMIKKLSGYDNDTAIAALEKSIENGWQGVFPEKEEKKKQGNFYEEMEEWASECAGVCNDSISS